MATPVIPMIERPESESLALAPIPQALSVTRAPELVLEEAQRAAVALKKVIDGKKKKVTFRGETYLQFEDWQTLGRFYGVTARIREVKEVHYGDAHGFEAFAEAISVSTGASVSAADAICLNDEPNWKAKPLAQLRSMAQTRACAKAMRNVLAWVVVLAGYEPTPAEEMPDEKPAKKAAPKTVPPPEPGVKLSEEQMRAYKGTKLPDQDKATAEVTVMVTGVNRAFTAKKKEYLLVNFNTQYDNMQHVAVCWKPDLFAAVEAAGNAKSALLRFLKSGRYLHIEDVLEDFAVPKQDKTEITDADTVPF